jgi:Flp pilus assembly pilin Flp
MVASAAEPKGEPALALKTARWAIPPPGRPRSTNCITSQKIMRTAQKCVYSRVSRGRKESVVINRLRKLWCDDAGQDIAEYAVMLAVILVLVVGTIRLIGSNANNVFSNTASSIQ